MEHMLLAVPDVTCQHCVRAITEFVSAVPGVVDVEVDLDAKVVRVDGTPARAAVVAAIDDAGYDVEV